MKDFGEFLNESVKAEDFEAAIIMGIYKLQGKELDDKSGISDSVIKAVNNDVNASAAGEKIAATLLKNYPELKTLQCSQTGRIKASLSKFWTSYGASNKTPKTDIMLGNMRVSLKVGVSQLMSGGKAETMATFQAAIKNSESSITESTEYKNTLSILENFVEASVAPTQLRPLIKSGENELVNQGEHAHKQIMAEMDKLFSSSEKFQTEFVKEAMTGRIKFGESSPATAEYILVVDHAGTTVDLKKIDDAYCLDIAKKTKIQARFKTSSKKQKGVKVGYNFWSVVSLIVGDKKKLREDSIIEEGLLSKLKGFFGDIRKKFKSSVNKFLGFLGFDVDVTFDNNINF